MQWTRDADWQEPQWGWMKALLFRFTFCYFSLYILTPGSLAFFPFLGWINSFYSPAWNGLLVWTGKNVMGIGYEFSARTTGSGDRTVDFIALAVLLCLALALTALWCILERGRRFDPKLLHWLNVAVRYYLGFVLITYGFFKVIKTQFPFMLERLVEPYGEFSPMGLLWTFMGYSTTYNFFTGGGEILAGALLFFRRTTTAGALLSVAVMGHVAMLNFTYDVPVKLFSSHLVLMGLFLAAQDARRIANFFLLNRNAAPADLKPHFRGKTANRIRWAAKILFIGTALFNNVSGAMQSYSSFGEGRSKPELYGIYSVERFVRNGEELPPLITDEYRWRWFVVEFEGRVSIRRMNDDFRRLALKYDAEAGTVAIHPFGQEEEQWAFSFQRPAPEELILSGQIEGDEVEIAMKSLDLNEYRLFNRSFRWVNEFPFNR